MLGSEPEICTVTFSEFLEGNPVRGVKPHLLREQERVCKLAHASWIDEYGSRPGNDLGTWIGEREENAAWDLLRETRELFKREKITTQTRPEAYEALYAAEGSDWFWWYGDDQTCEAEPDFDDLFRHHLRCAYMLAALEPPPETGVQHRAARSDLEFSRPEKLYFFARSSPVQGRVSGLANLERQRLERRVRNCLECKRWSYGRIE